MSHIDIQQQGMHGQQQGVNDVRIVPLFNMFSSVSQFYTCETVTQEGQ